MNGWFGMGKSVHDMIMLSNESLIQKTKSLVTDNFERDRALIACLYLGGFRISEVLGTSYKSQLRIYRRELKAAKKALEHADGKKAKKIGTKRVEWLRKEGKALRSKLDKEGNLWVNEPMHKYNLKRMVLKGKDGRDYKFLQFENVIILKRREKAKPKKSPPLPYHKEKEMIDILWSYVKTLPNDDDILFDISDRTALKIVKKALGENFFTHYLRHLRITRLKSYEYDFSDSQVMLFTGHKDPKSLIPYSHGGVQELREKMI